MGKIPLNVTKICLKWSNIMAKIRQNVTNIRVHMFPAKLNTFSIEHI